MRILACVSVAAVLGGCSPSQSEPPPPAKPAQPSAAPAPASSAPPVEAESSAAPSSAPAPTAQAQSADARVAAINAANFDGARPTKGASSADIDDVMIRAEVLLGRDRFSPGVIDGRAGTNVSHALAAYQGAHGLSASGMLDAPTWQALTGDPSAAQPVARPYTITADDVAGPFAPDVGEDFVKLAALPQGPLFTTPLEALSERFHMSQGLMTALNPGVDFKSAGTKIVVVDAAPPPFHKGDVASIEVSKANAEASAYDKEGKLIAFYPATVGSTERPSPSGVHKVNGVAEHTDYVYDPKKLHWGPRSHGKLVIKPGPNGPVGTVWIDLNAPSYGIHGSPDPDKIGKTASHGCVRLTNWDAEALAAGVKPGVKVTFEGNRKKA